jgi:anti-sigma factor RsiW
MHEEWTDRLSELLDGELAAAERAAVESHLEECQACARIFQELLEVVERASRMEDRPPQGDLWPDIERRIRSSRLGPRLHPQAAAERGRRLRVSVPQLIAASIALVTLSAGTVWLALGRPGGTMAPPVVELPGAPSSATPVASVPGQFGETSLMIAQLERTLADSRARLDPETLRMIEENLAVIDGAIAEVQQALAQDPGSMYLNLHMADTMRRKLQLLQEIGELASAQ